LYHFQVEQNHVEVVATIPRHPAEGTPPLDRTNLKSAVPISGRTLCGFPLSPAVQHLLRLYDISEDEAKNITTSGPFGRLLKGDLLSYIEAEKLKPLRVSHPLPDVKLNKSGTSVEVRVPNGSFSLKMLVGALKSLSSDSQVAYSLKGSHSARADKHIEFSVDGFCYVSKVNSDPLKIMTAPRSGDLDQSTIYSYFAGIEAKRSPQLTKAAEATRIATKKPLNPLSEYEYFANQITSQDIRYDRLLKLKVDQVHGISNEELPIAIGLLQQRIYDHYIS
jgi:hypothetical protein